jgi:hypothetical protein
MQGGNEFFPYMSVFTIVNPGQITASINLDVIPTSATDPTVSLTTGPATLWLENCGRDGEGCISTASVPVQIVGCSTPTITSISPSTWFAGKTYDSVVINGTNFITKDKATDSCPATPVKITAADRSDVPVSNIKVKSDQEITVTVAPDANDPTETATVTVGTAPNTGNSASLATPPQILGNQILCDPSMNCTEDVISTTDGTQPPAQNVVVGQQIHLTTPALPSSIKATKTTWTVPTTPANIGERLFGQLNSWGNPSTASAKPTVLKTASLTTYWLYPKASVPVTYQYCVNIQGVTDEDLKCSFVANASFNVTGPTATITPSLSLSSTPPATGVWWVSGTDSGCFDYQYLVFGTTNIPTIGCSLVVDKAGIGFQASPSPNSGRFEWVQLITSNVRTGTATGREVAPNVGKTGLDTLYPYPTIDTNWNSAADSPAISLEPILTSESRAFSARMYLMWTGNADNVDAKDPKYIDVPIGYVDWSIDGTADQNKKQSPPWSLATEQGQTTATFTHSTDNGTITHGLPVWTNVVEPPEPPKSKTVTTDEDSVSIQLDNEQENQQ